MKILITGGSGYFGANLARRLSELKCRVQIGVRKNDVTKKVTPASTTEINWENYESLKHSISEVDCIIHAAGPNQSDCGIDPEGAINFRQLSTSNLLKAALECHVKSFFYISTAHVYRTPLVGRFTEKSAPRSRTPYSLSHLAAEQQILSFNSSGVLSPFIVRLSNIVGPPILPETNCWHLVANSTALSLKRRQKININSPKSEVRNFITITDACNAIAFLIFNHEQIPQSKIINLGGVSMPIVTMKNIIAQIYSNNGDIAKTSIQKAIENKHALDNVLKIRNNTLERAKFHFANNFQYEIEQLLLMCDEVIERAAIEPFFKSSEHSSTK